MEVCLNKITLPSYHPLPFLTPAALPPSAPSICCWGSLAANADLVSVKVDSSVHPMDQVRFWVDLVSRLLLGRLFPLPQISASVFAPPLVRHGYPWVSIDQAHGRPRQVGPAY
jgi:hypothetical protein